MVQEVDVEVDPVEEIPDGDRLYKRVHRKLFKPDRTVMTGAFQDSALSVDWSRYSTPNETRARAFSNPNDSAVVAMDVGPVRQVPGQTVEHTPSAENRAHTEVIGEKKEKVRVLLRRLCTLVLPLDEV